jgi:hypothetical protein
MFERTPQETSLVFDDHYVSQLSGRITHLRELIMVMVDQDKDTRRQSELLFTLLRQLRTAKMLRLHGLVRGEPQVEQADDAAVLAGTTHRQLSA